MNCHRIYIGLTSNVSRTFTDKPTLKIGSYFAMPNGGHVHRDRMEQHGTDCVFYTKLGWTFWVSHTLIMTLHPREQWVQFTSESGDVLRKNIEMADSEFVMTVAMEFKDVSSLTNYTRRKLKKLDA